MYWLCIFTRRQMKITIKHSFKIYLYDEVTHNFAWSIDYGIMDQMDEQTNWIGLWNISLVIYIWLAFQPTLYKCERFTKSKKKKKIEDRFTIVCDYISWNEPQISTNTLSFKKPYWHTRTQALGCYYLPNAINCQFHKLYSNVERKYS